ncbi:hypothetical protein RCL1_002301 [Eukaryota sp. TZLM3-RCL]
MKPLICIIGPTASQKSKFAISLAKFLNSSIINTDIMQVYQQCQVATNVPSFSERCGVPHHLFGLIDSFSQHWDIRDYEQAALNCINVRSSESIPILCGGTLYYLERILFRSDGVSSTFDEETNFADLDSVTDTSKLYEMLQLIDPDICNQIHPHNSRKIRTAVNVLKSGLLPSSISHNRSQRKLRFSPVLIWIDADDEILMSRIDNRVDQMVERGLIEEAIDLTCQAVNHYKVISQDVLQKGVFQSIGVKELVSSLSTLMETLDINSLSKTELVNLLTPAIDQIKLKSRRYVFKQRSWFNKRLQHSGLPIIMLNSNCIDTLCKQTEEVAEQIQQHLNTCTFPLSCPLKLSSNVECCYCNVVCQTEEQFNAHLKSKSHYRRKRSFYKQQDDSSLKRSKQDQTEVAPVESIKS